MKQHPLMVPRATGWFYAGPASSSENVRGATRGTGGRIPHNVGGTESGFEIFLHIVMRSIPVTIDRLVMAGTMIRNHT